MKKICFYTESIFDLGGIQRVVTTLANNLYKDYDITILCSHNVPKSKIVDYNLDSNIKVEYLPKSSFLHNSYNALFKFIRFMYRDFLKLSKKRNIYSYINYGSRASLIDGLTKYINNNNFDYVLGEGLNCGIFLSLVKKRINKTTKMISCWHSSFERYINEYPDKLINESIKNNDLTVVLSKHDRDQIKMKFGETPIFIYNPIKKISTIKKKKENKFIAVGRYNKIKGYDRLIKAFSLFNKKNKEWKLEIIGEGEEKENLQNLINELNLNDYITLTGKTNNINKYYESAKCFLMTSMFEGLPMVLLEAMQHRLPIIVYDIPIVHEILPKEVPIIEQGNIEKFAEKMLEISLNSNNEFMCENYDNMLNDFYIENVIKEWKKVLK